MNSFGFTGKKEGLLITHQPVRKEKSSQNRHTTDNPVANSV